MDPPSYFPSRDDVSIHSNAPSYTPAPPPAYDTLEPVPPPRNQGQTQKYCSLLPTNPLPENNHIASWPSLTGSGHQNRAYANVAARRAKRDEAARETEDTKRVLIRRIQDDGQREEESKRMEVTMEAEAKSWDHLLAQMADWKERERGWDELKRRYGDRRKKRSGRGVYGWLA